MDVRCERCSTEYELEDDTVPEGGCAVQCTTCGHTFTVRQAGDQPMQLQDVAEAAPPPSADWLLETSDGKLHRFRNLTSLQKWIIERKVTRDDKISRTGHAWRRLGEIVELGPFFDVVDEADRARAAAAGRREKEAPAPRTRVPSSEAAPLRPRVSSDAVPPRIRVPSDAESPGRQDAFVAPNRAKDTAQGVHDEIDTSAIPRENPGLDADTSVVAVVGRVRRSKFKPGFVFLMVIVIGAGILYVARRQDGFKGLLVQEKVAPVVPPPAPVVPPPPTSTPTVSPVGAVAEAETPAASAETPVPPPQSVPAKPVRPIASASAGDVGGNRPAPVEPSTGQSQSDGETLSYDQLVVQADRLLENGSPDRAMRLYDRALKVRSDGVEALTGIGYVMLDKSRNQSAIGFFRRALAEAPAYGPALFGLGESSRSAGDIKAARDAYQRYLRANPTGPYASAAKRQIGLLAEADPSLGDDSSSDDD